MLFKAFSRKVVVVVPSEEDWKQRLEWRKEVEGDDVPESIMLEMKGGRGLYRAGSRPCQRTPHCALHLEGFSTLRRKPGSKRMTRALVGKGVSRQKGEALSPRHSA